MSKVKILWIGDGVTPTGFATVNHNVIKQLPKDEFEVHHLAINYFGDPHPYEHHIYPAMSYKTFRYGDVYGLHRLEEMKKLSPDIIFILNDIWVIDSYLETIKEIFKDKMPKVVVYFPVDGAGYFSGWFRHFDIVTKAVVYTQFGKDTVLKAVPNLRERLEVIPHGTDTESFYQIEDKAQLRKELFANVSTVTPDSFIVLNANRNQPRKRIDLSLLGFALFALGKPDTVKYYHHAGTQDAGWNIIRFVALLDKEFKQAGLLKSSEPNLESRLILTNLEQQVQRVTIEELNRIYNVADVGVNTSLGEGWGLTSTENAATRVAQIVPNHTACAELFRDCGLLTNIKQTVYDPQTLLHRSFIDAQHLAKQLTQLYEDETLKNDLATRGYEKFTSEEYQWSSIAKTWERLFKEILNNEEKNNND